MANDTEWVQDVRRWYFGGHPPEGEQPCEAADGSDEHAVGYDAALPGLSAPAWSDRLVPGDA